MPFCTGNGASASLFISFVAAMHWRKHSSRRHHVGVGAHLAQSVVPDLLLLRPHPEDRVRASVAQGRGRGG